MEGALLSLLRGEGRTLHQVKFVEKPLSLPRKRGDLSRKRGEVNRLGGNVHADPISP